MKKITTIIALAIICQISFSQIPQWTWTHGLTGLDDEKSHTIEIDQDLNLLVAGAFNSQTLTVGNTSLSTEGSHDVFVSKFDSAGNHLWSISMGGTGFDEAWDIIADFQNNIYVTGHFYSSSFSIGTDTTLYNQQTAAMFFVKLDSNGNFLWAKASSGSQRAWGRALGIDELDNVYLGGNFLNTNMTLDDTTLINQGSHDMFVAKFTSEGQRLWTRHAGSSNVDLLRNMVVSPEYRNVYVIGDFESSSITFDNTTFTNANTGQRDNFVVKYNQDGSLVWAKHIYGTDEEFGSFIAVDWHENIYATGQFQSSTCFFDSYSLNNSTISNEVYLVCYDPNGTVNWVTGIYGDENDNVYSIATDKNNGLYLCGWFNSTNFGIGSDVFATQGGFDAFISKFDFQGNYKWTKPLGSNDDDQAECIVSDYQGELYVTGKFSSPTLMFDSIQLTNTGDNDVFVGKISMVDTTTNYIANIFPATEMIFPNPVIETINLPGYYDAKVYSITGQLLLETYTNKIDVSALKPGIYVLNYGDNSCKFVKR